MGSKYKIPLGKTKVRAQYGRRLAAGAALAGVARVLAGAGGGCGRRGRCGRRVPYRFRGAFSRRPSSAAPRCAERRAPSRRRAGVASPRGPRPPRTAHPRLSVKSRAATTDAGKLERPLFANQRRIASGSAAKLARSREPRRHPLIFATVENSPETFKKF